MYLVRACTYCDLHSVFPCLPYRRVQQSCDSHLKRSKSLVGGGWSGRERAPAALDRQTPLEGQLLLGLDNNRWSLPACEGGGEGGGGIDILRGTAHANTSRGRGRYLTAIKIARKITLGTATEEETFAHKKLVINCNKTRKKISILQKTFMVTESLGFDKVCKWDNYNLEDERAPTEFTIISL